MANTVEQFGAELKRKMAGIDYSPIFQSIKNIVDRSIQDNFNEGGRWGAYSLFGGGIYQWKKSKRVLGENKKNRGMGGTLVDKSNLRKSINVQVVQEGTKIKIIAGSGYKYAAVYQFGFNDDVTVPSHTRTSKKGKTYTVDSFTRRMIVDRRPFVVLQKEDIEEIKYLIVKHLIKVTGTW